MEFVKKNLISLICGVVALLALVAVFVWPLDGYFETLKQKADTRAKVQGTITSLMNKPRTAPAFTLKDTKGEKLPKFPSQAVITKGKAAKDLVTTQANEIYKSALLLNMANRDQVVPGTLPVPKSQPVALAFRRNYEAALKKLREEDLVAGVPPTQEEVDKRADALWESMKKQIIVVDNQPTNLEPVVAQFDEQAAKIKGQLQEETATKYKMYVDPSKVLAVPADIPVNVAPDPVRIWWAQVEYWITSDLVNTIAEMNASSKKVTESPVKNLLQLTVDQSFYPPAAAAAAMVPADGVPAATGSGAPDPTVTIPESNQTPTKRISNNLFDVVHFKTSLDIEADKVPLFLKSLATNRFITVTKLDMNSVDSQLMLINGYVYGPNPVVTLTLEGEAVFMRDWSAKLMPAKVKELAGIDAAKPN